MNTVFLYCAAIGGALLVLQFLLLLFGAGSDGDSDGHFAHDLGDGHAVGHDQGSFLRLLSLQTVTTFATFFGLVGLLTHGLGWSSTGSSAAATLAGGTALLIVVKSMQSLARLQSSGTLDLGNAIGQPGNVYLRIPARGHGHGRVLLTVQGRTVECRATSRDHEIPTGAQIRVVDRAADDTLVVEPHE